MTLYYPVQDKTSTRPVNTQNYYTKIKQAVNHEREVGSTSSTSSLAVLAVLLLILLVTNLIISEATGRKFNTI